MATTGTNVPLVSLKAGNAGTIHVALDCGVEYSFSLIGRSAHEIWIEGFLSEHYDPLTAQVFAEGLKIHHNNLITDLQKVLLNYLEKKPLGESTSEDYDSQVAAVLEKWSGPAWSDED